MLKSPIFSALILFLAVTFPSRGFSEPLPKQITYSFSLKGIANNELIVTCKFQGNENGSTELILPHQWANQSNLDKNIENLSCLNHEIKNTDQPHIKNIFHAPEEAITISYHIKLLTEGTCHENYFRPIGGHSHFFAIGHGMFIIPTKQDKKMQIYLEWEDLPPNWEIANSFGVKQTSQELIRSPYDLQSAAFMGGDFQIIECNTDSNPIYVAMRGKWPFSSEEFANVVKKIFISQRDFWSDYDFPFYLVSIIPIDAKNSTGGTGLTDTFSLFLGDNKFSKDEYLEHLTRLVSHEHFHTWNGHKIRSSEPEGSMYWFSEGFTEYYAVKLNHSYGIMNQNDYIDHINGILTDYYLSPVHEAPNTTIVKEFWTDPDVRKLPYVRGFTLALYLDAKIQSQGQGLSLDDFMHDLLAFMKQNNHRYSSDEFFQLLGKYLDQDEILAVKSFIFEGATVPVPKIAPVSDYTLGWEDYFGFNLQSSLSKGIIQGVKRGSPPFKAGLTNGSKLLEINKEGTVVILSVIDSDEDGPKTISYDLIEIKKTPQYAKRNRE